MSVILEKVELRPERHFALAILVQDDSQQVAEAKEHRSRRADIFVHQYADRVERVEQERVEQEVCGWSCAFNFSSTSMIFPTDPFIAATNER